MVPHYAETAFMKTILLLFSHMNFTHKKISHAFNLRRKVLQLLKCSTWETFNDFFSPKLLHPKFELNLFAGYFNQN